MNIEGYSAANNIYEARKSHKPSSAPADIPPPPPASDEPANKTKITPTDTQNETASNFMQNDHRMENAFRQVDLQRVHEAEGEIKNETEEETENAFKEYMAEEEDEEGKKDEKLVDYLLEALKGQEKELRMEGNSRMSDEVKREYYERSFPDLFPPGTFNVS